MFVAFFLQLLIIQKQNDKALGLSDIDKSEIFDLLSDSDNVK